jgi:hypothetical protein
VSVAAAAAEVRLGRYTASDPDWTHHCTELAVGAVAGRDIWHELGGCPRSWREAADLYRRMGVRTLAEAVSKVLGDPIKPSQAMRGDVVMIDEALGVCRGEWVECLDRMQPIARATLAWKATGKPQRQR